MTLWIAWAVVISALIAVAAAAVERAATYFGAPRRVGWIAAMVATAVVPLTLALRTAPANVLFPSPLSTTRVGRANADHISDQTTLGAARALASGESAAPLASPPAWRETLPRPDVWAAGWRDAMVKSAAVVRRADSVIVRVWLFMSLALLVAFVRAVLQLRRQRSHWSEADAGMCRVLVARRAGPAVVGFLRPRIVIPQWALTLERNALELLLRHETEHIRAGDQRALLGARLLLIAFPWNVALWWMMGRLRLSIELDCDARVIRAVGGAREYGLVLLAVGEQYATALPLAASLVEPRLSLEERIDAMTTPRIRRPVIASLPFAAIAFVALTAASQAPRPEPIRAAHVDVVHPKVVDTKVVDAKIVHAKVVDARIVDAKVVSATVPVLRSDSAVAPRVKARAFVAEQVASPQRPADSLPAVISIETPGAFAALEGTVIDSIHRLPLANATVSVEGTGRSAQTTASGQFRIDSIPAGRHAVTVVHPLLDAIGLPIRTHDLPFAAGARHHLDLIVPSGERIVSFVCSAAQRTRGPAALIGFVHEQGTNRPAIGAVVELVFTTADPVGRTTATVRQSAPIDSTGLYRICGLPAAMHGRVKVSRNGVVSLDVPTEITNGFLAIRAMSILSAGDAERAEVRFPDWIPSFNVSRAEALREQGLSDVGYVERKQTAMGYFQDGKMIDHQSTALSELAREWPGLRVRRVGLDRTEITDARGANGCVNYYVDGMLWQTSTPGDIDQFVRPAQVVAVEVYRPSNAPPQYKPSDRTDCVTVLVWTVGRIRPDSAEKKKP